MKLRRVFGGLGLAVLLLLDRRNGARNRGVAREEAASASELRHWTFTREFITAWFIVLMFALVWLPNFLRDGFTILLQQASIFIGLTSSVTLTVVSIGAVLVVLPYGSSKNRTDTAAALVVFAVLGIVSVIASYLYSDYESLLDFCEGLGEPPPGGVLPSTFPRPGQPELSCNEFSLYQARRIAPDLERITTLSSLGQLIPLLSVSKDILQAWFSPPGLVEEQSTSATRRAARRERRLSTPKTIFSYAPVVIVSVFYAALSILSYFFR